MYTTVVTTALGLLSTICIGILGWAFKISSRTAVNEARIESIRELISTRFDNVEDRLERIERHVLNGKGGK